MKTAYVNGIIYTGEGFARGFTVEDGRFAGVFGEMAAPETGEMAFGTSEGEAGGTASGRETAGMLSPEYGQADETVDLGGRFVCPGFNDSHIHLLMLGKMLSGPQLAAHTGSLTELQEYLREFIRDSGLPAGSWIQGFGFNHDYFRDGRRFPDRYDLDKVSTEYPICIFRACGHMCVVNSRGLELLGVDEQVPLTAGGSIPLDEAGRPLGQFFENAKELVNQRLPRPSVAELKSYLKKGCERLNAYGITSCQSDDYQIFSNLDYHKVLQAYEELAAQGELSVRVNEQVHFTGLEALEAYVAEGLHRYKTPLFRHGPLKLLGDGSLGARTACLSRPYADAPDTRGILVYTRQQLEELCAYANRAGMQIAVHAIGDGCLDLVLDAYEKALAAYPRTDHRHGIVHCQITRPEQLKRMEELHLHAYIQSVFLDYDVRIVRERAGECLAASSYQAAGLLKRGLTVSNGSDSPVEEPCVLKGIQCAVTRRDLAGKKQPYLPEEALGVGEAIDTFTKYGAYASFEEKEKGCIKEGMLADFVILSENPFEIRPEKLGDIQVKSTYLGGKRVYG